MREAGRPDRTVLVTAAMPGSVHEGIRLLFQDRPSLARELLELVGQAVPDGEAVEDANAFSDIAPPTYAADVVVAIRGAEGPRASVIVEVQTTEDDDKRFAWPRYVATEHAQRRCPTWLVVIATTGRVARWARRPIETFQPGSAFAPVVIGPAEMPRVTELARALAHPELAILSAILHSDDGSVAVPALQAARSLDSERSFLYTDLVVCSLSALARAAVEAMMIPKNWEPMTPEFRDAWRKAKAEGKAEGVLAGRRTTLARLLRLKFRAAVTDEVVSRLDAADTGTLDRWEERILTASTIDDALS